jgi:hypothetical protein
MKSRIPQDKAKSRKLFLKKVLKKFPQASYDELRAKVSSRFDGAPVSNSLIAECKRDLNLLNIEKVRDSRPTSVVDALKDGTVALADAIENCRELLRKNNFQVAEIDLDSTELRVGRKAIEYITLHK